MELARKLFMSLEKSTFYEGVYLVLNDGNFVRNIYADSDEKAIEMFMNEINQKGVEHHGNTIRISQRIQHEC